VAADGREKLRDIVVAQKTPVVCHALGWIVHHARLHFPATPRSPARAPGLGCRHQPADLYRLPHLDIPPSQHPPEMFRIRVPCAAARDVVRLQTMDRSRPFADCELANHDDQWTQGIAPADVPRPMHARDPSCNHPEKRAPGPMLEPAQLLERVVRGEARQTSYLVNAGLRSCPCGRSSAGRARLLAWKSLATSSGNGDCSGR
jgi:hypothetical protein